MAKHFVLVQPVGFLDYFLSEWEEGKPVRWHTRRSCAVRFTGRQARQVADQLNARLAAPTVVVRELAVRTP